jgi:hypothetical protein
MQKVKVSPGAAALGLVTMAFLINYAFVGLGLRPYLYCGLKDVAWAIFEPARIWIILVGFIGFAVGLVTKRLIWWGGGLLLVLGAYILPEWSRILFSLGKSCEV